MLKKVIEEIVKDYLFLRRISPKNELLKYFIVDENSFTNNLDKEIHEEFMEKFRGSFPTLEELKKRKKKIDYAKYFSSLYLTVFINYDFCLDGAINFALMRN
jgi:hypothetical protein